MSHDRHPATIKRLKRAEGHLHMIIEMLEKAGGAVNLPSNSRP